jgi:hypothetical protein
MNALEEELARWNELLLTGTSDDKQIARAMIKKIEKILKDDKNEIGHQS